MKAYPLVWKYLGVYKDHIIMTGSFSNHEETDSRTVLYCAYAQEHGYDNVYIGSPDSYIFFEQLHAFHAGKFDVNILFDTGTGNEKRNHHPYV